VAGGGAAVVSRIAELGVPFELLPHPDAAVATTIVAAAVTSQGRLTSSPP
jgi:hypothetical protein